MKKIKLNEMEAQVLDKREESHVLGGEYSTTNCGCACAYNNQGGSSESSNGKANNAGGLHTPGMIQVQYTGISEDGYSYTYTVWETDKSKGH